MIDCPAKVPAHWPDNCYIRPIRSETGGLRAQTHMAELRTPANQRVRGFVKHFTGGDTKGLFNEWFGYTMLSALGVPQPEAAVMRAPFKGTGPLAWSFVSLFPRPTSQGTPKQLYDLANPLALAVLTQRLYGCPALPLLIAADQLISNADRNLGNLVFTGETQFVAIDHSDILGGPAWTTSELWHTQVWSRSKLIEDLVSIEELSPPTRARLAAASEVVEEVFFTHQMTVRKLVDCDTEFDSYMAMNAVWWRGVSLASWFRQKLELLT